MKEPRAGVADLRRELAASREYLQSIIQELEAANEELQSANEEILSSNEEMQSTKEELDTAKEELQRTNEELNTVNEELHSRNDELTRANSDLGNLLGSVDIAIVIVSNELGIRRFTPKAEQLFNLIPGDVGRSIGQINPNFVVDGLDGMIRETIDKIAPREREVQDKSGRWHLLRVRPYKGLDNRLDGAVLSLVDIDDSKRYSAHVERTRDYFMAIVAMVRDPLLVLDARLHVRFANKSFYSMFGVAPLDGDRRAIEDVAGGIFRIPELLAMLQRVLDLGIETDVTLSHTFPTVGHKRMMVNGRRLELGEKGPSIVVAIEDITGGKG